MRIVRGTFVLVSLLAVGLYPARPAVAQSPSRVHWVATWGASPRALLPADSLPPEDLTDATVRQIVHLSIGGSSLRVDISNVFGTAPLHFTSVHVAKPISVASAQIDPATDRALTFSGNSDLTIPAGAEYTSDPVKLTVAALSSLAITFHLDIPPGQQTGHPFSRSTSFLAHGDLVSAADLPNAKKVDHWYQITGVDVAVPRDGATIIALGDSITDGPGATLNGNDRFTDFLAARLRVSHNKRTLGVLNEGISGNHLLTDGVGPNAFARFDRDVLAQAGVRYLIVLEGINDLSQLVRNGEVPPEMHTLQVQNILASYKQLVLRAHSHGIKVMGATLLPCTGAKRQRSESDRLAINEWIRTAGNFDALVDFDKVTRDPSHPERLLPLYDSGDHLHPSPAGYRAMAEAIPLTFFTR
ncbi:MAG TPA: SGNH/GDSL hydrolase family protein [Terriglobia bacterium]|nr:SGNH/GDSL hydrolase family protein [Terriglobia bacterium]